MQFYLSFNLDYVRQTTTWRERLHTQYATQMNEENNVAVWYQQWAFALSVVFGGGAAVLLWYFREKNMQYLPTQFPTLQMAFCRNTSPSSLSCSLSLSFRLCQQCNDSVTLLLKNGLLINAWFRRFLFRRNELEYINFFFPESFPASSRGFCLAFQLCCGAFCCCSICVGCHFLIGRMSPSATDLIKIPTLMIQLVIESRCAYATSYEMWKWRKKIALVHTHQ